MKRNQRWVSEYRKYKMTKNDQMQRLDRQKLTQQLKSLQCSSVQQIHPTNQSHEMSWIQKLVNNIDNDQKPSTLALEPQSRNFSRKSSLSTNQNNYALEKGKQSEFLRPRNAFSVAKYEKYERQRQNDGTPIDKLDYRAEKKDKEKEEEFQVARFGEDYERRRRIEQRYGRNSVDKYSLSVNNSNTKNYGQERPSYMENNSIKISTKDYLNPPADNKQVDLNQTNQSYGRIKKVNKYKQYDQKMDQPKQTHLKSIANQHSMQKNYRMTTESNQYQHPRRTYGGNQNGTHPSSQYEEERKIRMNTMSYGNYVEPVRSAQSQFMKRRASEYAVTKDINKFEQRDIQNYSTTKHSTPTKSALSLPSHEQQLKMDEMAKKLNQVLQNINKKSKLLTHTHTQSTNPNFNNAIPSAEKEQKNQIKYERQSYEKYQRERERAREEKTYTNGGGNSHEKIKQNLKIQRQFAREPSAYNQQQKTYSRAQQQKSYKQPLLRDKLLQSIKDSTKNPQVQLKYNHQQRQYRYGSRPQPQRLISQKYPSPTPNPSPYSSSFLPSPPVNTPTVPSLPTSTAYSHTASSCIPSSSHPPVALKSSLFLSKHLPHQIILQQSSSQLNSQHSTRTEYFIRQFKSLFLRLDAQGRGQLSQSNCRIEDIDQNLRYLFGGIFNAIKMGRKMGLKEWIEECQAVVAAGGDQVRELFGRAGHREMESEKWNNQTNYQSDSKRSSGRSEVVKKYEFVQDLDRQFKNNKKQDKNRQKVNWNPSQYSQVGANIINLPLQRQQKPSIFTQISPSLNDNKQWVPLHKKTAPKQAFSQKQNIKIASIIGSQKQKQKQKQKKDFQKMCENLNNKLNNYLTNIKQKQKQLAGHHIPLEFSELAKHWSGK